MHREITATSGLCSVLVKSRLYDVTVLPQCKYERQGNMITGSSRSSEACKLYNRVFPYFETVAVFLLGSAICV